MPKVPQRSCSTKYSWDIYWPTILIVQFLERASHLLMSKTDCDIPLISTYFSEEERYFNNLQAACLKEAASKVLFKTSFNSVLLYSLMLCSKLSFIPCMKIQTTKSHLLYPPFHIAFALVHCYQALARCGAAATQFCRVRSGGWLSI